MVMTLIKHARMKKPLNILFIEDNENDVRLILHELYMYWPQINHLRTDKLLDLANALKKDWDVILSDFTLPAFDGLTALRMVRENEIDTPFIVVSGRVEEDIAASMMRLGANDYVMKDNLKRLAPAIERELKTAAERAQAGLKLTGMIKYETVPDKSVITLDKQANQNEAPSVPAPGNDSRILPGSDGIKERHKAVVNILYAANLIRKAQQTILQREDLSEPQFNVLSILRRQYPNVVTLLAIKDETPNKTSDISRMVDKMVKAGLVNYSVNPLDKRTRDISITSLGLEVMSGMDKFADEMFLCDALLSEEHSQQINLGLQNMLSLMREN